MLREFSSVKDLFGYIDSQIAQYRKAFGDLIRMVEDLRARAEKQKKILEVIGKLTPGAQAPSEESSPQIDIKGVKVIINPSPIQELSSLEKLLEEINVRITRLTNIRKDMEALASVDVNGKILAFFKDDIPETIILKI